MPLILTRKDVEAVLTMPEVIAAVEDAFGRLVRCRADMPQRVTTRIEPHRGTHLAMPAYLEGDPESLVVKVVSAYPDNPTLHSLPAIQAVLLYHDAATGELRAIMDAEHLTGMRTGAASGVATRRLAREDARTLALFGSGVQARYQIEAVHCVRPLERALVVGTDSTAVRGFCERASADLGIPVEPARDAASAVAAAGIICTATSSPTPVFNGEWLRPGTHINAVGAFTARTREVDTLTVQRSTVFVDHFEAARAEAGDILIPFGEGAITLDHVAATLGEVVLGEAPGRTDDAEITLFKSVGVAVQDAAAASLAYRAALERGLGARIEL